MAFYFFGTKESHFWGAEEVTTSGTFDSDYTDRSLRSSGTNEAMGCSWDTPLTDCWIHFKMLIDSASLAAGDTGFLWNVLDSRGFPIAQLDLVDQSNVDNRVNVGDNGTFTNGGEFGPLPKTLTDIDIRVQIDSGGNNIVSYYQGGSLISTVSRTHSQATGITGFSLANNDTGGRTNLSEFMVADEDTRGLRLAFLDPDGNGNETDWTGGFQSILQRSDGKAIFSTTNGDRSSFTLSAYSGPASPVAVRGVFTQLYAGGGGSGPNNIDPFLRIGSTNYDSGDNHSVSSGAALPLISEWANNPATSASWLTTAFASLEAGVETVT